MLARVNRFLESLSSHLALYSLLGGGAVMSAAFAWVAHATVLLSPYAPFSWLIAASFGALIFTLLAMCAMKLRDIFITSSIKRIFYEKVERVNPVQSVFRDQRIYLADMVLPYDRIIKNKTFIGCEIIGPANVGMHQTAPGLGQFNNCHFNDSAGVVIKENAIVPAGILLQDCSFLSCKLFFLILLVPTSSYRAIAPNMPNFNWITAEPHL